MFLSLIISDTIFAKRKRQGSASNSSAGQAVLIDVQLAIRVHQITKTLLNVPSEM
jgi:hypothetical protein